MWSYDEIGSPKYGLSVGINRIVTVWWTILIWLGV